MTTAAHTSAGISWKLCGRQGVLHPLYLFETGSAIVQVCDIPIGSLRTELEFPVHSGSVPSNCQLAIITLKLGKKWIHATGVEIYYILIPAFTYGLKLNPLLFVFNFRLLFFFLFLSLLFTLSSFFLPFFSFCLDSIYVIKITACWKHSSFWFRKFPAKSFSLMWSLGERADVYRRPWEMVEIRSEILLCALVIIKI